MLERRQQKENTFTNVALFDTPSCSGWTEILRSSVEISEKTLMPGEYGAIVAKGALKCAKETKPCSLKMLKGDNIE